MGVFTPADIYPQLWTSTNALLHKIHLTHIGGGDEFRTFRDSDEFVCIMRGGWRMASRRQIHL